MSYWPGTNVRKSTGNAFTARPACVMATPNEMAKARTQALAFTHEQQKATGKGFGHVTMGGLSKHGQKQLKSAQPSISISKRGSSKGRKIIRGGI
jgi:hypothetical protein